MPPVMGRASTVAAGERAFGGLSPDGRSALYTLADIMDIWVRKCSSFAEERVADREFWAAMSPDARVNVVEELRQEWAHISGQAIERLRRTVSVLERQER